MLEINKAYNVDCLEGMKLIDDKSIDMIFTDPPYGTTKNKWDIIIPFEPLWEQYKRIIKDNGAIILFASGMFTSDLMQSNKNMWRYNLIWKKTTPTGHLNANKMQLRLHEDICVFYKNSPTYNPQKTTGHIRKVSSAKHKLNSIKTSNYGQHGLTGYDSTERYPTSVLEYATDKQKQPIAPTQKPVELCRNIIRTYTNEGDLILDNTCGAGSIGVASKLENRNYILMDNGICENPKIYTGWNWADVAMDRISKIPK